MAASWYNKHLQPVSLTLSKAVSVPAHLCHSVQPDHTYLIACSPTVMFAQSFHGCLMAAGSVELSVVLCDDNYITDLNREHRGKAAPTDVLSFPAVDWDFVMADAPLALGDVVISLNTAERQAAEQG